MIVVVVFSAPAMTTLEVDSSGSLAATPGRVPSWVASSVVSEVAEPAAPRTPAVVVDPGVIVSRFVPRPARRDVTPEEAPWPTATRAMTEATPMMTPSIVSAARIRLEPRRAKARPRRSGSFMRRPPRPAA